MNHSRLVNPKWIYLENHLRPKALTNYERDSMKIFLGQKRPMNYRGKNNELFSDQGIEGSRSKVHQNYY